MQTTDTPASVEGTNDWTAAVPQPHTAGCSLTMSYADEPNSIVCRLGHMIDIDAFTEGFDESDFFHPCPKCNAAAYDSWKREQGDDEDADDGPASAGSFDSQVCDEPDYACGDCGAPMQPTNTTPAPPAYIRGTCPVCGATTDAEAETSCKVERDFTDEYRCKGGAQDFYDGPGDGFLYFPNPAMAAWVDRQLDARRATHPEEFQ